MYYNPVNEAMSFLRKKIHAIYGATVDLDLPFLYDSLNCMMFSIVFFNRGEMMW